MAARKTSKDNGTMMFIVAALLLTLVGAGAGLAVGTLLPEWRRTETIPAAADIVQEEEPSETGLGGAKDAAVSGTAAPQEPLAEDPPALQAVQFPPVLTTLAAPKGKWIRLEGSVLMLLETEEAPELLAERSGEQIFTYLRTVRLDQLEGPSGVLGLRQDLNEMVQALSGGQVRGVLIHGLVVE